MARNVRLLLCSLLILALVPAAARAQSETRAIPVPAADQLMTTAHALAVNRWGMDPCGAVVSVAWTRMGWQINARAQWMSIQVGDPSTYSDCSITYNLDVDWDWPKLCTVVEHELGHLAGHDHVDDPHDVMSPYYVFPAPECSTSDDAVTPSPTTQRSASSTSSKKTASRKAKRKVAKRTAKAAKRKRATPRRTRSAKRH